MTDVIAGAYEVFAPYGFTSLEWANPEDCNVEYYDLANDNQALTRHSLRELTVDDLGTYYHQAVSILGSVSDFKHFLPRVLELLVADPSSGLHPAVLVKNLEDAEFQSWPRGERQAVLSVLGDSNRPDLIKAAERLTEARDK